MELTTAFTKEVYLDRQCVGARSGQPTRRLVFSPQSSLISEEQRARLDQLNLERQAKMCRAKQPLTRHQVSARARARGAWGPGAHRHQMLSDQRAEGDESRHHMCRGNGEEKGSFLTSEEEQGNDDAEESESGAWPVELDKQWLADNEEPTSDPHLELESVPEGASELESEPELESVPEGASEPEPELESVLEGASGPEPELESVLEGASEPEPELESVLEGASELESEPPSELESVPEGASELEPEPHPELESVPEGTSELESDPHPELQVPLTSWTEEIVDLEGDLRRKLARNQLGRVRSRVLIAAGIQDLARQELAKQVKQVHEHAQEGLEDFRSKVLGGAAIQQFATQQVQESKALAAAEEDYWFRVEQEANRLSSGCDQNVTQDDDSDVSIFGGSVRLSVDERLERAEIAARAMCGIQRMQEKVLTAAAIQGYAKQLEDEYWEEIEAEASRLSQ